MKNFFQALQTSDDEEAPVVKKTTAKAAPVAAAPAPVAAAPVEAAAKKQGSARSRAPKEVANFGEHLALHSPNQLFTISFTSIRRCQD